MFLRHTPAEFSFLSVTTSFGGLIQTAAGNGVGEALSRQTSFGMRGISSTQNFLPVSKYRFRLSVVDHFQREQTYPRMPVLTSVPEEKSMLREELPKAKADLAYVFSKPIPEPRPREERTTDGH